MELKQFISKALSSIVEGVVEAQTQSSKHGAFINPGGLMRTTSSISNDAIWDNRDNNFARLVNFDIGVTVEEGTQTDAKIGVLSGMFNLGTGGKSENKDLSAHRIQFSVPVLLPSSIVPKEARKSKQGT